MSSEVETSHALLATLRFIDYVPQARDSARNDRRKHRPTLRSQKLV